jgi:Ca2+-binding EF-hand superfamily protein
MNRRISMSDHFGDVRKPLAAALALGALGLAGLGFAQSTSSVNSSGTGSTSSAKAIPPSKAETADSAFKKLDAADKGYVTRDDAKSVEGFDRTFQSADANHDGKLTGDEFKKAWTTFTGNPQ